MQSFFAKPGIGLDLSSRAVRVGTVRRSGGTLIPVATRSLPLEAGVIDENYAAPGVKDRDGLAAVLRRALQEDAVFPGRRIALSLPDGLFRVQLFDFDDLPPRNRDRERLIRWRFEKSAAFDTADTVLRYQVLPRAGRGLSVLAGIAKQAVIASYEDLLAGLGYDVWLVGLSSFHALNFYDAVLAAPSAGHTALVWITEGSYTTIITDRGVPRFYRYREIKTNAAGEAAVRITREIEDALHFYTHRDPQQALEIPRLCCAGDSPLLAPLTEGLRNSTSLAVELLTPASVTGPGGEGTDAFAAAFGAGVAV